MKLFYSYSHRDERHRERLETHLSTLRRQGLVREWHDRKIIPGEEWKNVIDENLKTSEVILLLISPDFVDSDYCYETELGRALEMHEQDQARVIPIIIRPTDWEGTPFSTLQALPENAKPVVLWRNRDEAWHSVAKGIRIAIAEMKARSGRAEGHQEERENADLQESQRESAMNTGHITVGEYMAQHGVEGIQRYEPPLHIDDVTTHYRSTERPLPDDLRELEFDYLARKVSASRSAGKGTDFNNNFALRELRIERLDRDGVRSNRPILTFEPSNYKYYLMCNDALDLPLLAAGADRLESIRERHLTGTVPFDWANLPSIPLHMWFATVTGVVTSDRQFAVALRSNMQGIEDSRTQGVSRGAMSAAEGMFWPADSRSQGPSLEPSPFKTAIRALYDELGLVVGQHFSEYEVKLLALGFDLKRYQPVGVFFVELPRTPFRELHGRWQIAPDHHENKDIVGIAATSEDLVDLLVGKQRYDNRPIELFSNHQQFGVVATSLYLFGDQATETALRRRAP